MTVLRAFWLFDGVSSTLRPDPIVVLDGAKIAAVGNTAVARDADVIDLPGATLLPGMIDTHVHLAFDASPDPLGSLAGRTDAEVIAAMKHAGQQALRGGGRH
ncbi:hypothetical protein [Kibdelosporangium aridum]|uniref:hypothetical protein n=1 Tax=Kibdelosporangium aridum TaxID=2030 RepID=UPI0005679A3E|nr:hypothetical protein [Kibdelosporangium aridum]